MSYLEDMFGLAGKTAVVTGGGGTLGGRIAAAFARAGANVIVWDVRAETLDPAVRRIVEAGGAADRVDSGQVNLLEEESVRQGLAAAAKRFGRVDILLNAAGGNRGKAPWTETKIDDYEFVLRLNLVAGCFLPTKIFADYWIKNEIKGCVINIASMSSYNPLSGVWAYSAAKAGVVNQTMGAAKEFAPHGIRVNALAPGFFLADQNRALLIDEKTGEPTARGKEVLAHTPFNRFGEPDELCGTCLLLASDRAAGFISGVTIPIDGAYMCHNI